MHAAAALHTTGSLQHKQNVRAIQRCLRGDDAGGAGGGSQHMLNMLSVSLQWFEGAGAISALAIQLYSDCAVWYFYLSTMYTLLHSCKTS